MQSFGQNARQAGIDFVCGVPDSLLRPAIEQLETEFSPEGFLIAANEGAAVGLAIGHYIASGAVPLVFMQNSGLGNAVNPLVSLASRSVYGVPMVLLVGWRGEVLCDGSQKADEPQHLSQGRITLAQLELLDIPYSVLESNLDTPKALGHAVRAASDRSGPVAVVVRSEVIESRTRPGIFGNGLPSREDMIRTVAKFSTSQTEHPVPIVATTGMASRELFETRKQHIADAHPVSDFFTVGGMGHAISIATALARAKESRRVICLDGDGALLMHTGALLLASAQKNLVHVVLDNGVHDSVGGQLTGFQNLNAEMLAIGFGYDHYCEAKTPHELENMLSGTRDVVGSFFVRALCQPGNRSDLSRPNRSPAENKDDFMRSFGSAV